MKTLADTFEIVVRLIFGMVLFGVSAFCVFAFLASFEPGDGVMWIVGYGVLGCVCTTGAMRLLVPRRKNTVTTGIRTGKIVVVRVGLFCLAVLLFFLYVKLR